MYSRSLPQQHLCFRTGWDNYSLRDKRTRKCARFPKSGMGRRLRKTRKELNEHGGRVVVDFAVPRLWFSTPTSDGSTTHASARVSRNGVLVERKHTKSFRVRANSVTLGLRACETLVSHIFGEIAAYDRDEFLHDSKSSFRGRRRCREFFSCGGML